MYHVMLRGLNQSQLFYDDEDRETFLARLGKYKEQYSFLIFAYCLMGNHVHLLIKVGESKLSDIVKSVTVSYAAWFNRKYDRRGYLFQGRYKSEPINSTDYLYAVLRYIHNNPVKIGESITYWTSYNEYIGECHLADTEWVLSTLDEDSSRAKSAFRELMHSAIDGEVTVMDVDVPKAAKDNQAIELIKQIANIENCMNLQLQDKAIRDEHLAQMKQHGLTIKQISRLTGLNRGVIQRAGK